MSEAEAAAVLTFAEKVALIWLTPGFAMHRASDPQAPSSRVIKSLRDRGLCWSYPGHEWHELTDRGAAIREAIPKSEPPENPHAR